MNNRITNTRFYVQDTETLEYVTDKGSTTIGDSPEFGLKENRKSWKNLSSATKWCNEYTKPKNTEFRNWKNRSLFITTEVETIVTSITHAVIPGIFKSDNES